MKFGKKVMVWGQWICYWGHYEVWVKKKLRAQCSSMHKLANKKKIRPLSLFKVPKATCIKSVLWNILRLVIFLGFWPLMTSDDLKIPFSHFQWVTMITSFCLVCNMPMFLEEKCRSFCKSLQVFRSHLKSFGSLKSLNKQTNRISLIVKTKSLSFLL